MKRLLYKINYGYFNKTNWEEKKTLYKQLKEDQLNGFGIKIFFLDKMK